MARKRRLISPIFIKDAGKLFGGQFTRNDDFTVLKNFWRGIIKTNIFFCIIAELRLSLKMLTNFY